MDSHKNEDPARTSGHATHATTSASDPEHSSVTRKEGNGTNASEHSAHVPTKTSPTVPSSTKSSAPDSSAPDSRVVDAQEERPEAGKDKDKDGKGAARKKPTAKNNVRKIRMEKMMSKAELARRAGMSTLTIDRVEHSMPCRMDTKRKILEALGLKPSDRVLVFGEDD
jgi:DNA-binding Xre family transcriptional regulator